MYHSITFGDGKIYTSGKNVGKPKGTNTWDDWHLIPASRPVIASPGVSTNFVTIPGRHGAIDMTDYLTGGPIYGQRSGSWEFFVANDYEHWDTIRSKVAAFLHGKRYKVVLEDVPTRYWDGRFTLNEFKSGAVNSTIVIDYVIEPYNYSVYRNDNWLWDPFNFETDDLSTYKEVRL